jgi:hypothetical protein
VSELEDYCGSLVVRCCYEKLVAEVGDSSRTQRKGNVRCWKLLPSNDSEDVNVDTSVGVKQCTVKCSHALYERVNPPVGILTSDSMFKFPPAYESWKCVESGV